MAVADEPTKAAGAQDAEARTRRVAGLLLRLALWYALFLLPFTGLGRAYGACYRTLGDFLYGSVGEQVSVRFEPMAEGGRMDTAMTFVERRMPPVRGQKPQSSRLFGYLPTTFFAALVLSMDLSWRRRRRALCFGLPLMTAFVGLRMGADLVHTLVTLPEITSFTAGPTWTAILAYAHELLAVSPSTGFVAAAILGMLVCLPLPAREPA